MKRNLTVLACLFLMNNFIAIGQNQFPTLEGKSIVIDGGEIQMVKPIAPNGWARGLMYYTEPGRSSARFAGIGLYGTETPDRFYMAHGSSPWSSGMGIYVLKDGKTGIGTLSPKEKLSVTGDIGVTGDLKMSGADSYIWTNGTGTGATGIWDQKNNRVLLYTSENSGHVGIGTKAVPEKLSVEGSISVTEDLKMSGADSYIWTNGTGTGATGIWDQKNNRVLLYTSENSGHVGIGTKAVPEKLSVEGSISVTEDLKMSGADSYIWTNGTGTGATGIWDQKNNRVLLYASEKLGGIGIGTKKLDPNSKLTVAGGVYSREVKVKVNAGADFVFEKDYKLPKLDKLENFVKEKKHLPEIPSEKEMQENGLELGEMNIRLLQKVEELTLYVIDQNKQLKNQNEKIEALQKEIDSMKKATKK